MFDAAVAAAQSALCVARHLPASRLAVRHPGSTNLLRIAQIDDALPRTAAGR